MMFTAWIAILTDQSAQSSHQDPVPPSPQLHVACQAEGVCLGQGLEGTDDQCEGSQSHHRYNDFLSYSDQHLKALVNIVFS